MRMLITGVCGFVGTTIVSAIRESGINWDLIGIDNFCRRGSEENLKNLKLQGVRFVHGDLRNQSDIDSLPGVDWILDAAANASVLAGADGTTSPRQLMEHNLQGTINLLEKSRRDCAGFILLSTSRVYSIPALASLPVKACNGKFELLESGNLPQGLSTSGISESFSTASPISLYGASKLASESIALEYGCLFNFPVWINRCGVMAGAGQFGRPDQGIFSYWINSCLRRRKLRYIGFGGLGHQVRDCLHPRDMIPVLTQQLHAGLDSSIPRVANFSGGLASATSLRELSDWCDHQFGTHDVESDPTPRMFDLPWVVLDHSLATQTWNWRPTTKIDEILLEIASHAKANPGWLEQSC